MICFSIERSQVTRYGPRLTIKSAQSPFFPGKLPDEMVGPKPHSVLREQFKPMPDPDLEISGGGGVIQILRLGGVPGHGLLVWSKNKGGRPSRTIPLDLPLCTINTNKT